MKLTEWGHVAPVAIAQVTEEHRKEVHNDRITVKGRTDTMEENTGKARISLKLTF